MVFRGKRADFSAFYAARPVCCEQTAEKTFPSLDFLMREQKERYGQHKQMGSILNLIYVPLAMILKLCYYITNNYGLAIILFAFLAKLIMVPVSVKSEIGRRKMSKVQPKLQQLQQKYKNNTRDQRYMDEVQAIYREEGYSQMSGCLPTLIQFPLIMGLWNAIRNPLTYVCGMVEKTMYPIFQKLTELGVQNLGTWDLEAGKKVINEIAVAQGIDQFPDQLAGLLPEGFKNIDLNFFGLNLGDKPVFGWHWTILIPIVSALTSFLVGYIGQRIDRTPGAAADPTQKSMNFLLYTMPLISLWMGFSFQIGIGVYWISSNIFALIQTLLLPLFLKEKKVEKPVKEKKLNYNQIEKMKREQKEKE